MNFYPRHIGDYHTKAGRCTLLQHGAFSVLMDKIYNTETFPTLEQAIEITWAQSDEEIEAVKFVLNRFFLEKDGIYFQKRIIDEIVDFRMKSLNHSYPGKISSAKTDKEKALFRAEYDAFKLAEKAIRKRMREHLFDKNELSIESASECKEATIVEYLATTVEKTATTVEINLTHVNQPITNNQEPRTSNHKKALKAFSGESNSEQHGANNQGKG